MVPASSHKVSRVSWYSGSCRPGSRFVYVAFTLSGQPSQAVPLQSPVTCAVRTPECTHSGLGSFPFARRYSGNRCFFLFLRVLRCFSSPGSPPWVMCWPMDGRSSSCRVSPFRNPWITGYLLLPMAYRSLSRLSSAPGAKASALRSSSLDPSCPQWVLPRRIALRLLVYGFCSWRVTLVTLLFSCASISGRHLGCLKYCLQYFAFVFSSMCSFQGTVRKLSLSVEIKGFEPLTPCLQGRCSPN